MSSYDKEEAIFGPASYPELTSYWEVDPIIKVCKVLRIPKSRVEKALSYWKKLGYTFDEVIYDDESISCAGKPLFGEIIITIPDQTFDYKNIAITRRTINQDMNMIIYAKIFMQEKEISKERVLEHEIGHALGWNHTARSYHLMHKMWERGGHDSSGLSKKRYQELYEVFKLNSL